MDSEVPTVPIDDEVRNVAETSRSRSHPSKKNQGKIPKRIHKAEREKMKREHLNELFLALANALELTEQNHGKASIVSDATRVVKDMVAQIESLRRENAALLSESQYVGIEKNELQDENSALEVQIGKLHSEIKERVAQSKLDLNVAPPECQRPELASNFMGDSLRLAAGEAPSQQAPIMGPVFVIPLCSDLQAFPEPDAAQLASRPNSNVSKPSARYPTPADLWPSKVLDKQPESVKEFQRSVSYRSGCSSEEQGLANV